MTSAHLRTRQRFFQQKAAPAAFWGVLLVAIWMAGCGEGERPAQTPKQTPAHTQTVRAARTIVAMGDSLTEGWGVEEELAYPAQLEARLRSEGYDVRVINAGVSGETSSGARSRVEWVLTLQPDVVILETGANDGFRGIDPAVIEDNVDAIVAQLQAGGATVVLAGMQIVRNLGRPYTEAFASLYPRVASARGAILIPFFLEGVAARPALNQADGIHPNAEGYRVVAETVYSHAVEALRGRP